MITTGKPIWVESLMTDLEYAETARKYPNMFSNGVRKPQEFECDFKWRKGMGANISTDEMIRVNNRLDEMRKQHSLTEI